MPLELVNLNRLWSQGLSFLGTKIAIMGGAMSWVSERHLVAAISNAGGFGVLACGSMSPDLLAAEIKATKTLTNKPFGVNLITIHQQLMELIEVCGYLKVGHIILANGLPKVISIQRPKELGIKVICFAPTVSFGKKLISRGADALIIEGSEAGGHVGVVSTSVLAQEILPAIRTVPIFVAGGIGRGEAILSYLEMGAAGVQLGTRFICANECIAHTNFKKAFIRASSRDAVLPEQLDPNFPVIPVRALINQASRRFVLFQQNVINRFRNGELDHKTAQLEIEHYWIGALKKAVIDGDIENGSLMSGQSVGMITQEQSANEIINELVEQTLLALNTRRIFEKEERN